MRKITQFVYIHVVKPILFLFPADNVHEFFLWMGRNLGRSSLVKKLLEKAWSYNNKILEQRIQGLDFKNPIGLSAGFDYNADLVNILPCIGFGFHSIGTLTNEPYGGNPGVMLARLPKSRSLLVNKGFKNKGVDNVLVSLTTNISGAPRGVSIGATNKPYPDLGAMIGDLVTGFQKAEKFINFDYYELNISCPNLLNLQNLKEQLATPHGLVHALEALDGIGIQRPLFIKMPLEKKPEEIKDLMQAASNFSFVKGLIFSNLAKDRNNKGFDVEEIKRAGKGNFSGKPVEEKSNEILRYAYRTYGERFTLIGVGGVFTPEDAYKKIRLGASLVQMITGMVFMGPEQIGLINKGLVELLKKDGYKNIRDTVGVQA